MLRNQRVMVYPMDKAPEYSKLNFDTKPTTVDFQVINVTIDPELMLSDYAKAYSNELIRRNPQRAQVLNLKPDELFEYFKGLLLLRVQSVNDVCKEWRRAKALLIPSWIEFTLTQVGTVTDHDRGLKFVPQLDGEVDINAMLVTSNRLASFLTDGIVLHKDALPRGQEGNYDVMSMVIIQDYVVSQSKMPHPIASYVAAFLGFKLEQELAFAILYRIRYDDINYIRDQLIAGRLF